MINLFEHINALYRENKEWNYYDAVINEPFGSEKARKFIEQYFEYGAKKRVILPFVNEIDSMRHVHTVSAFFIGLLIKRKLCPGLSILSQGYEEYEFSYLWFLVCLFHDMGYVIEKDWTYKFEYRCKTEEFLRQNNLKKSWRGRNKDVYEDLGLLYVAPSRFNKSFSSCGKSEISNSAMNRITFNNGTVIEKAMYTRKTVLNYFEYCKMAESIRHYDHGIVGGFWLFDNLMKNYYRAYREERIRNSNIHFENFMVDGHLHFSAEQRTVFAYLADCIISHNMWPANESTYDIYIRCGLEELVKPRFTRVSFRSNPILFILALADTIEPIKLYSEEVNMKDVDIWKGVNIKAERKSVTISLADDRLSFQKLLDKVNGLDNWIDVEVQVVEARREIKIEYNIL